VIQQINLYQDCLKEKKDPFPPSTMGVALGTAFLALLLLFGISRWQINAQDERYHDLQSRKAEILEALKKTEEYSTPQSGDTLLQEELAHMRTMVRDKSALHGKMAGLKGQSRIDFSRYLEALGRTERSGLWLNRIEVREAGKSITLAGSALQPWLVSQFTEDLARHQGFAGLTAARLWIQDTGNDGGTVNFILETKPEKTP